MQFEKIAANVPTNFQPKLMGLSLMGSYDDMSIETDLGCHPLWCHLPVRYVMSPCIKY